MNATVLITGSTDGLGRALALRLAADGVSLFLHGRNPDKLAAAEAAALAAGAEQVRTFVADLADLDQVRNLARDVRAATDRLDTLVNNAGIGFGDRRETSADGYELRFAVNHLAGLLLTHDLLPLLRASAPSRVVNVASLGQEPLDLDDLNLEHGTFDGRVAYRKSKLAQIMATMEFADWIPADEVTFTSLHPGTFMPTKMVLDAGIAPVDTVESGVQAVYRLVTDPTMHGPSVSGTFFDRTTEGRAHAQAFDESTRRAVWRRSFDLVGVDPSSFS